MRLSHLIRRLAVRQRHASAQPFAGGGEMAERINAFAWSDTSLGPIAAWSPTLRASVGLILSSNVPMLLLWTSDFIQIYNDAFAPFRAAKHPGALGQPFIRYWPEAKPVTEVLRRAFTGSTVFTQDQPLVSDRRGALEDVFVSYAVSPVHNELGVIAGLLMTGTETTARVVGERRTRTVLGLSAAGLATDSLLDALHSSAAVLEENQHDVPFALFYRLAEDRATARLVAQSGLPPAALGAPPIVDLADDEAGWPLARVAAAGCSVLLDDVQARFAGLRSRHSRDPITHARVHALSPTGRGDGRFETPALLVTGIATRLPLDEDHARFHDLLGATASHVVGNVLAREAQRARAEARASVELERTIEERRRAQEDLRESEQRFRQLAAALEDAFFLADGDTGGVLYVSPAYERIWLRPTAKIRSEWIESIHAEDRELVLQVSKRARQEARVCDCEYRILRPDGSQRWIYVRIFPIVDARGHVFRVAGIASDITERKQAEKVRTDLEWQLRQSQKLEALGTLTGGIAHDFNNLLGAMLGHTELARNDPRCAAEVRESLDEIWYACQRAKELVQRLLSCGRPQEAARSPIDLKPVLVEAVRLLRSALPASVELNFHADSNVPAVLADASLLHQVVLNLVTNAWHALGGRAGRIDVRLELCRVDSRLQQAHAELQPGPHVRLSVSDTGEGIDRAILNRIFEPFFTTKAPGSGTGLGLSVVHGIVRSHGGTILVESERGRGAKFHVYLPASGDAATTAVNVAAEAEDELGHGELILVLDDEAALVRLAELHLQRLGYRVEGHTQPIEALKAFRADPDRYDLVITDYNMPQMSGIDVAQQLLRLRPDVVIALVSGYMQPADIEQARALGIQEVILKPFTLRDLSPIVHQLLGKPPHTDAGAHRTGTRESAEQAIDISPRRA